MSTTKKAPRKKTAKKKSSSTKSRLSPEQKAATATLKLVDEAAGLLRKGISTGAATSEKARLEAKKKAHVLLNKASSSLSDLLGTSTSTLRRVINKL